MQTLPERGRVMVIPSHDEMAERGRKICGCKLCAESGKHPCARALWAASIALELIEERKGAAFDRELADARQAVIGAAQWLRTVREAGERGSAPALDAFDQRLRELEALREKVSEAKAVAMLRKETD